MSMYLSLILFPFLILSPGRQDCDSPQPQASWGCNNKPYLLLTLTLKGNSQGPCFKMGSLSEPQYIVRSIHTYSILTWTEKEYGQKTPKHHQNQPGWLLPGAKTAVAEGMSGGRGGWRAGGDAHYQKSLRYLFKTIHISLSSCLEKS